MKELKDMEVVEIKSLVHDNLVQIEQCQANIKALNEELNKRRQVPPTQKLEPSELTKKNS